MIEGNAQEGRTNKLEELGLEEGMTITANLKSGEKKNLVLARVHGFGDGGTIADFYEAGGNYRNCQPISLNNLRRTSSGEYEVICS